MVSKFLNKNASLEPEDKTSFRFPCLGEETGNLRSDKGNFEGNSRSSNIKETQEPLGFEMETTQETNRKPPQNKEENFMIQNDAKVSLLMSLE